MALRRRIPRWADLGPLLQFDLQRNRRQARLSRVSSVEDLRRIAKRRTPTGPFDYVDGAAESESTHYGNRDAFGELTFIPAILAANDDIDLRATVAGETFELPVGIAPTGFTRMMQAEGEVAGVRAAERAGVPFSLSTMGTQSIEDVAAAAPNATKWFQLYLWRDREASLDLIQRAWAAGYRNLLVTVDTAIAGRRLRDVRNGLTVPPKLTLGTVLDASYRPEWWFNFLTTDPLTFASLSDDTSSLAALVNGMFDPTLSMEDLAWIREQWPGKLFVKGVLTAEDTQRSLDNGADGLVVSNHGGRQLDRAPTSFDALPVVRAAAGDDVEIILDSGIMHGADILAALAYGADFTLIGRAYLYGLMAAGEAGVRKVLELLEAQMRVTMQLMGAATLADLNPDMVRKAERDRGEG
ncbi:alpha-hydroxy-acid oxidizing protein [Brevibacterium sp. p3-SID960]|uniref:alpha-hydroxy acid oxidase n=1 Tax=Brevibacterium sp. p3-SID960 TaxID=2916063 RepID=UPI0021A84B5A|nr:alpha-hydroxy acid oxidase [Brevibacterium sp. p3-SID960]MCT1690539.1 alpha-hydroxy-acid oxidizing protein [Brevibacterium sp. p3-SID960]